MPSRTTRHAAVLLHVVATMLATTCLARSAPPFAIRVVDDATGRGVPLVELRTVSRIRFWTDSAGYAAIDDPALLGRTIFFTVASHGYTYPADALGQRGTALELTPGGEATLRITRVNIAERLYRVTGEGIYRDSVVLGRPTPIAAPLLTAQVTGQDSALTAVHRGRIWWFWGDTNRQAYPLGHFGTAGATSALPGRGGLDPDVGVDLRYVVDASGFSRPMLPATPRLLHWLDGVAVVPDDDGRDRLVGMATHLRSLTEVVGRGLVVLRNDDGDAQARLEPLQPWPVDEGRRLRGHPFTHEVDGIAYLYGGESFPTVRVPARLASVRDPEAYEAYVPGPRDATGHRTWSWTRGAAPLELADLHAIAPDDAPIRLRDAATGRPVRAHHGCVRWNGFRNRWIMIVVEHGGEPSFLGEIWYAEADAPEGPWRDARKIVTHDRYSFYNPVHHPVFDQEDGRLIYFEGTYTTTFSRDPEEATPRYDYNQIMYRLDLADPRLRP